MLKRFASFVGIILAAGVAYAEKTPSPDAEIRRELVHRVDVQKRATGIVVGLTGPAGHRIIAYGTRGLQDHAPVNGSTVYDIGSITKIFTALLLTEDVERGRLKLYGAVNDCVRARTGFLGGRGRPVTFADLATHTSGLPLRPDNLPSKNADDRYAGYTGNMLLAFLATFKPGRAPGRDYNYSNVGYGLLGLALTRCDHSDYATLLHRQITAPLQMRDTALVPSGDMLRREAHGYDPDFRPLPHWHMGALAPAGGLRSTANDLLKLLDVALGRTASPLAPAFKEMTAVERPGGMQPATAIALGWNIYRQDGHDVVWKNGNVGGFRTFIGYEPKSKKGVVALANMETAEGVDDIGLHFLDTSYPVDMSVPREHNIVAVDPATLDHYVASYRFPNGDVIIIRRDGDHLVAVAQGNNLPIAPEGGDRFYIKVAEAELTFRAFVDGHPTELVWNQNGAEDIGKRVG